MNRFKLVCIGVVVLITAMIMCSCTANPETIEHHKSNYKIIRVGSDRHGRVEIYKVKTPEKTYTIFCNHRGGSVILN